MEKPTFNKDQIMSSSDAAKHFGELRKRAKQAPQFITENGNVDTVVLNYDFYENMYVRLQELENNEQALIIVERIDRLEHDPGVGVDWTSIRRSGTKTDE